VSSTKETDGATDTTKSRLTTSRAVELKGGMYTFMSLRLHTDDLAAIDTALAEKVNQAPAFFKDTPVVIDLGELDADGETLDGAALLACIRRHHLAPIAATLTDKSSRLAGSIGLPLMEGSARRRVAGDRGKSGGAAATTDDASRSSPSDARQADGVPDVAGDLGSDLGPDLGPGLGREIEHVVRAPLLVDRPVRSGQQIYARETDLIVMGQVGPGAEVIADNNIHVYGPLRGRALCGVSGNAESRIFCQSLEAELVSVAGTFRMLETIPAALRGKPAQIWLDDERLNIEPL